jgi:hypothetical protein
MLWFLRFRMVDHFWIYFIPWFILCSCQFILLLFTCIYSYISMRNFVGNRFFVVDSWNQRVNLTTKCDQKKKLNSRVILELKLYLFNTLKFFWYPVSSFGQSLEHRMWGVIHLYHSKFQKHPTPLLIVFDLSFLFPVST